MYWKKKNQSSDFVFIMLYLVQITTKSVVTHKDRFSLYNVSIHYKKIK